MIKLICRILIILVLSFLIYSCASKKEQVVKKESSKAIQIQEQQVPPEGSLEQVQKEKKLEEEKRKFESKKLYGMAINYYNSADFEKAGELAQESVNKDPYNLDAQKLLAEIDRVLSKTVGEWKGITYAQLQEYQVRVEQAEAEIKNLFAKGINFYNNKQFDDALRELEEAEFKLNTIPFDIPIRNVLPQVRELIEKTQKEKKLQSELMEKKKLEEARGELELLAEAEKKEVKQKIKNLLEMTYLAIDQKKYDKALRLCDEILAIDPDYKGAMELKGNILAARHKFLRHEYLKQKVEAWSSLKDQDGEALIPYNDTIKFPSRREWQEISKRGIELLTKEEGVQEDPDVLAIQNKLESIKLTLNFDSITLDNILDYIRESTAINIIVNETVRTEKADAFSKQLTFKVTELSLKQILKLLLEPLDLGYTIEQKILTITKPELALGKPYPELYEVKDIMVKIQDFPGPVVQIATPASAARTGLSGASFTIPEEPRPTAIPEEQFIEVIKANTAGGRWDELGYTIELTPTQLLSVNAPSSVHGEIKEFLTKLRGYAGLMVQIDARFISVFDDFLKDIGINIFGGTSPVGTTEFTDGSGVAPSPGFFKRSSSPQHPWDLRGQSFNIFLSPPPPTGPNVVPLGGAAIGFSNDALHINQLGLLGSAPPGESGGGGLGVQYRLIGNQTLQLVLRAISKSEKGTIYQQPKITVFNGQRGNITVIRQIAYVQDYQVTAGALTASYDPVISVLNVGSVLDVKPVVSNDKKYVKMELRLYQLILNILRQRPLFANTPIFGAPTDALTIELPNVSYEAAESTVQIPDRSTLLIGGFKNITQRQLETKTPILGEIPVLDFFFSRQSKVDARQNEFVLITPVIIDMGEEEDKIK